MWCNKPDVYGDKCIGDRNAVCARCGQDMIIASLREIDEVLAGPPTSAEVYAQLKEFTFNPMPLWEFPEPVVIFPFTVIFPFIDYARAWEKVRRDYFDSLPKYVSHHVQEIDS